MVRGMSVCLQKIGRFHLIVFQLLMLESRVLLNWFWFWQTVFRIHFSKFLLVVWFYEIKLEVKVGFCMFFVVYMFSKQISYWNRIGRQLLGGLELADELADSFIPVNC